MTVPISLDLLCNANSDDSENKFTEHFPSKHSGFQDVCEEEGSSCFVNSNLCIIGTIKQFVHVKLQEQQSRFKLIFSGGGFGTKRII